MAKELGNRQRSNPLGAGRRKGTVKRVKADPGSTNGYKIVRHSCNWCDTAELAIAKSGPQEHAIADNVESAGLELQQLEPASRKSQFLALYAEYGSIGHALKAIGGNYRELTRWRQDDEFQAELATAADYWIGKVEREIARRAIEGTDEPVVSMGKLVATKRVYSDALLKLAARAADPNRYGDGRKVFGSEVGVKPDGTKYFKAYSGFDPDNDV